MVEQFIMTATLDEGELDIIVVTCDDVPEELEAVIRRFLQEVGMFVEIRHVRIVIV